MGDFVVFLSNKNFARNTQVAVEPGMPEATTVALDAELDDAMLGRLFASRFDLQIRLEPAEK